jgi:hypothetical protein
MPGSNHLSLLVLLLQALVLVPESLLSFTSDLLLKVKLRFWL